MLAPQGLAEALRGLPGGVAVGAPGIDAKDLKKEAKKRDKRMTMTAKDVERKKKEEEKEREKKEKEAEREREKERKRKEKEEKEALKAREKEAARLTSASSPNLAAPAASSALSSPSSPSSSNMSLSASSALLHHSDSAATGGGFSLADAPAASWDKRPGSKRRTMLFGKKDTPPKSSGGGSSIGDSADLRSLMEATAAAGGLMGAASTAVLTEKKERTFATLNEVLEQGSVSDLKKFIKLHNAAGKLAGEVLNQDGQTALHIACSRYGEDADLSLVKYLLKQKGANPSAKDNRQWTPLHCACQASASAAIVNALVHAGADVTSPNVDGTRPLDYFVRHGAKDKELDAFEQALDNLLKGNSINFKNPSSGETALHNAIRSGHSGNLHTIKLLLARAADVSITTVSGEAPLHYGVKAGRVDIVELLLSAGADPRQGADSKVGSPLALAEKLPESPEKNYILRQLSKQVSLIEAQEVTSPRQLLANKLEEAKERRNFTERMLKAREDEIAQLEAQVTEELQREQTLLTELERLKRLHHDLLAQRRRV